MSGRIFSIVVIFLVFTSSMLFASENNLLWLKDGDSLSVDTSYDAILSYDDKSIEGKLENKRDRVYLNSFYFTDEMGREYKSIDDMLSSYSNIKAIEERERPGYSFSLRAGYLGLRYHTKEDERESEHDVPSGMVGASFSSYLDRNSIFSLNLGYMLSFGTYKIRMENEAWFNTKELGVTNSVDLSIGLGYNFKNFYFDSRFGLLITNETILKQNVTGIGPMVELDFGYIIGAWKIALGGMFSKGLYSANDNRNITSSLTWAGYVSVSMRSREDVR